MYDKKSIAKPIIKCKLVYQKHDREESIVYEHLVEIQVKRRKKVIE